MSSFTIAHDIPGRMRIRYGKNKFSSVQGEVLKKDLYAWPMIESVEVNNVTGSVLMLYDKAQKGLLLNKTKGFRYPISSKCRYFFDCSSFTITRSYCDESRIYESVL